MDEPHLVEERPMVAADWLVLVAMLLPIIAWGVFMECVVLLFGEPEAWGSK